MSEPFRPLDHQLPLPLKNLVLENPPPNEEQVPMDVLFVGAGPAGLAGAIELAHLVKKDPSLGSVEIGVLEKASSLGGHSLSGAVVNPRSLKALFPDKKTSDFPFKSEVLGEAVYLLTETGKVRLPTPPTMHNKGNYICSLSELVRWMGREAEALGINIFTSFPADALIVRDGRVSGVRTTAAGLGRDGSPGSQFMPPTDITAKVTVLSEGTRGTLTQAFLAWKKITSTVPQIYALGVKELWKVKSPLEKVIHTLGWPLPKDAFGGSFIYPMGQDHVALGLVVGLDYKQSSLDVHHLLQKLKTHPLVLPLLEGGELVEWGAKTIPEGGLGAVPRELYGDGVLIIGDAAGFVNVPALKGVHYAIESGRLAAKSIFEALKAGKTGREELKVYNKRIKKSFIYSDLKKVRHMRHAFKSGFYWGGFKAALMTLTGGLFPKSSSDQVEDAAEEKLVTPPDSVVKSKFTLSKVDGVYRSSNKTRDDIPSHLEVKTGIPKEVGEFYHHLCPAGVYEWREGKLFVNAPNCVDCKATDVLGPRWRPREGGSGPNYNMM